MEESHKVIKSKRTKHTKINILWFHFYKIQNPAKLSYGMRCQDIFGRGNSDWNRASRSVLFPLLGADYTNVQSHLGTRRLQTSSNPTLIAFWWEKCLSTWHLLRIHRTCYSLYESWHCPTRENASSLGTRRFRHSSQVPDDYRGTTIHFVKNYWALQL